MKAKKIEPRWTKHGARLLLQRSAPGSPLNWLFLPGGPGLGSEVLHPLTSLLNLPGTIWHLDLPGDGSNPMGKIQDWSQALLEAVSSLENVILVGHSHGGMFALATPELETRLRGLVLLNTAPDMTWQQEFAENTRHNPLRKAEELGEIYRKHPTNHALKEFTLAAAPHMFTKEGLNEGLKSLKELPYNCEALEWTEKHFDPTYQARWIPARIPTLILSGSSDLVTPLKHFAKKLEFHSSNIVLREIKGAGHFPWIEKPEEIKAAFGEFLKKL